MKYIIGKISDYNDSEINTFFDNIFNIKKEKLEKYTNMDSKKRSIIGELLLDSLLLDNNVIYKNMCYKINKYGKPYFNNSVIFFNISHSFDYVIAAISKKDIGIDIEKVRKTSINVINKFATENEKEYILCSDNNVEERLFKIYTLKEAYFKMLGTNLNNILDIEFIIDGDNITCSDKNVNIYFINDINGYIIACCEKKE